MRKMLAFAGVAVMVLIASTAFAEVKVSMQDGRVSIVAKDATLRQILTEWASVGQTKIVNVERIPGGPMTIELTNMPEQQALDLLLHDGAASGRRCASVTVRSRRRHADERCAAGRGDGAAGTDVRAAAVHTATPDGRRRRGRRAARAKRRGTKRFAESARSNL
jgi:hypothetical protein